MDKVLIVEDDVALQKFLGKKLKKYKDKFDIIHAYNGEEAIKILGKKYISLLVTDILMPKVDGLALMSFINNKYPHILCIVMTGYSTPRLERKFTDDNIFKYFKKPFHLDDLSEAILQALDLDVQYGTINGIAVASFLQMIEMEQKTCVFEVSSPDEKTGTFFFKEGVAFDAQYEDLTGEEAAFKIIAMDNTEINLRAITPKIEENKINRQLTGLIMEALRRKDEKD
nr:hypothetical protein [uncultured bacterium]